MAAADGHQPRWSAHPWRARGLRLLVYALPIAGSLGFVRVATAVTGVPTRSLWVFLLWWLAMSLSATAVVSFVYAVSRRLLPLGALLDLSLVFPDESPSRFKLALRSGTVESLEERLHQLRLANERASAQEAAEILLQLAGALDVHDKITRGHAERVRAYSYSLGKQLGLGGDDLDRLNWAALLHDVGQARRQHRDPQQARQADRRGVGAAAPPSVVRRDARRAAQRMARQPGPKRSGTTTSTGTARDTRAASPARRFRSPDASSRSPTSTT